MKDLNQSIYSVCHESDLTPQDIALQMFVGYQVFLNKANPNNDTHHFHPTQLVQLQKITGSNLITTTMAGLLRDKPVCEQRVEDLIVQSVIEHTEAVKAALAASNGKKLTAKEATTARREIAEAKQALEKLEDAVNANVLMQAVSNVG